MESKWIAIKEKMPILNQVVLLFDDWGDDDEPRTAYRIGYLDEYITRKTSDGITHSYEWRLTGDEYAFNVTHWMPLSPP